MADSITIGELIHLLETALRVRDQRAVLLAKFIGFVDSHEGTLGTSAQDKVVRDLRFDMEFCYSEMGELDEKKETLLVRAALDKLGSSVKGGAIIEPETVKEAITDAIGYWEPRRILYNIALAGVVLIHFFANYPASRDKLQAELFLSLFVLAVLANVAYCAAYLGDIFAQFSGYRDVWKKFRWILFAIGVAFAGTIAHFMTMGFFLVH